jgi:hypothetical protein
MDSSTRQAILQAPITQDMRAKILKYFDVDREGRELVAVLSGWLSVLVQYEDSSGETRYVRVWPNGNLIWNPLLTKWDRMEVLVSANLPVDAA